MVRLRRAWVVSGCLVGGILSWGCQVHPITKAPVPKEIDILPVEHLREYVIGFPVHVAITVRALPNVSFNMLPFADFLNLRASIGVEITSRSGGEPVRYQPKPFIDPDSGKRGSKLAPGESRRMLADVSMYFTHVTEGEYETRFYYVETDAIYPAASVMMRFRKPTASESALLKEAAADRPEFSSWGAWTITCPSKLYDAEVTAENPLRFNLLLRRLLCAAEPPERADPAILDVLTGLYGPEGNALKAELYRARGGEARYQELRSQILSETPGLLWWMRMTDGGGAFIKSLRVI
jgi:hypothetical protein